MNIHHLELFYYVAKHGGIMEAVRNIPYGIQQPAVSGQVAQLEQFLGVSLFQRRPFSLTPHGEKLYRFIEPFFSSLGEMAAELQGDRIGRIRIGASGIVLREHLPQLFQRVRLRFPHLRVVLREGYQANVEDWLQRDELDLAVTALEKKTPPGIQSLSLLDLPLVLLVAKDSPYTTAEQLWKKDRIHDSLICLPAHELICKHFQQGLLKMDIDWFPSMEVSSLTLVEAYVAAGFGIGVSVKVPKTPVPAGLRVLDLPEFPPIPLGALWRGKPTPLIQVFLSEMQAKAKQLT